MIHFFLNGEARTVQNPANDLTLLRYLRTQVTLPGTKEGCGSGDCGACSVLLGDYSANLGWRYRAVNSCLTLIPQLAGKSVITVDALATGQGAKQQLHPAQQAMVDYHASQCGFCTPGIVMSLAALHQDISVADDTAPPSRHQVNDALSGNLCRCTGYRPIIEAATHLQDYPDNRDQAVAVWQPEPLTANPAPPPADAVSAAPQTEQQLQQWLQQYPDARLVAGATDLALEITQQLKTPGSLVAVNHIASLKQLRDEDDALLIGAAVSYSEMETLLARYFPQFAQLLQRLGSRQVRNTGTLGGNIGNASPIGDTPPVLLALGACIELASAPGHLSASGSRWLALKDFFIDYKKTALQPGEYIRTIKIPKLKKNQQLLVYKISKRLEDDISAVLAAFKITVSDDQKVEQVTTGFGGMAAIPKAALQLEQALTALPLDGDKFRHAAQALEQDFTPMSDVRASQAYRLLVAKNLVRKCALELLQPQQLSRIEDIHSSELALNAVISGGETPNA
ncbi:xanthine dehydrogenase small subunit [Bacterioplanoides pacificum]|uniref:Xanthine dehydrogenase small subunit n=1 Tax=Bacterioplanoides pacificum TaxID=1171596 RepID=A0ABV7VLZ2_9GAMM